jgi:hypothetical protein
MLFNTNSTVFNTSVTALPESGFPEPVRSELADPVDRDLLRRVKTFLSTSHRPGLRSLEVQASSGVVILRGQVQTFYEKQLSAQLARRVAGVVRLIDQIVVNHPTSENRQPVVTVRLQAGALPSAARQ